MDITKEILQLRKAALERQLGSLVEKVGMLQGAVGLCDELLGYLEVPEPPDPEEAVRVAKEAEVERILQLQHMIYDCSDGNGQGKLVDVPEARIDSD